MQVVFATYVHSEDGAVHLFHQLRCGPLDASRATATITAMEKAKTGWLRRERLSSRHGLDGVFGVEDAAWRPLLLSGPDGDALSCAVQQQLGSPVEERDWRHGARGGAVVGRDRPRVDAQRCDVRGLRDELVMGRRLGKRRVAWQAWVGSGCAKALGWARRVILA